MSAGKTDPAMTYVLQTPKGRTPQQPLTLAAESGKGSSKTLSLLVVPMRPDKPPPDVTTVKLVLTAAGEGGAEYLPGTPKAECGGPEDVQDAVDCACKDYPFSECAEGNKLGTDQSRWRVKLDYCDFRPPKSAGGAPFWLSTFALQVAYEQGTKPRSVDVQPSGLQLRLKRAPPPTLKLLYDPGDDPRTVCNMGTLVLPITATTVELKVEPVEPPCKAQTDLKTNGWEMQGGIQVGCTLPGEGLLKPTKDRPTKGVHMRCIDVRRTPSAPSPAPPHHIDPRGARRGRTRRGGRSRCAAATRPTST